MSIYLFLARHSLSDVKALGFDASSVYVEQMSLGFEGVPSFPPHRKKITTCLRQVIYFTEAHGEDTEVHREENNACLRQVRGGHREEVIGKMSIFQFVIQNQFYNGNKPNY